MQKRNPHGAEVVALDYNGGGQIHSCTLWRNVALGHEHALAVVTGGGQKRCEPYGFYAGQLLYAAHQLAVEFIDGSLGCILLQRQIVRGGQRVVGLKTEIHLAHLLETAQQQAGGRQQDQGDRDLCNDQRRTKPGVASAGGAGASAFLENVVHVGPDGGKGRRQSAD